MTIECAGVLSVLQRVMIHPLFLSFSISLFLSIHLLIHMIAHAQQRPSTLIRSPCVGNTGEPHYAEYSSSAEDCKNTEHSRVAPLPSDCDRSKARTPHCSTGAVYRGPLNLRSSDFPSPMSLVPDCAKCGITVYFYDEVIGTFGVFPTLF